MISREIQTMLVMNFVSIDDRSIDKDEQRIYFDLLFFFFRYIRGLYYTWKGFQKRHDPKWQRFYLTKQILIDADIALLRVFDCFMDSGSQVTLQLYIMLRLGSASMKCQLILFSIATV